MYELGGGGKTPYAFPISVMLKSAYRGEGGVRFGLKKRTYEMDDP